MFGPAAASLLSDMGAEVIKVEPPEGDKSRALQNRWFGSSKVRGFPNASLEIGNHGKRSIVLDLRNPEGMSVFKTLLTKADVFITNYLPAARKRLAIDVEDLKNVNDKLIYAIASGWGGQGEMADQAGFDIVCAWAASGLADAMTRPGEEPPHWSVAQYDLISSVTLANSVGMALLRRERTGEAGTVEVSLLSTGMWSHAVPLAAFPFVGQDRRKEIVFGQPLVAWYQTSDDRWLFLSIAEPDTYWREFCDRVGLNDIVDDPRFADMEARAANSDACIDLLRKTFLSRPLQEWRERLDGFPAAWTWAKNMEEVSADPQARANDNFRPLTTNAGVDMELISPPMHFDGKALQCRSPAPEAGQDTELVLLDLGYTWDDIARLKATNACG
jgi:formyl-CoA transferase